METLRFFQEAVELPHLADRGLRPPLRGDDGLDLCAERRDVLRRSREVVQRVGHALRVRKGPPLLAWHAGVGGQGKLTFDEVWMAPKLTRRTFSTTWSKGVFLVLASSSSHCNKSLWRAHQRPVKSQTR